MIEESTTSIIEKENAYTNIFLLRANSNTKLPA